MDVTGVRISGPLVRCVAAAAGDGGVVANSQVAHTLSTGKRAAIKKIMWRNRALVNVDLLVGYGDLTAAGSLFRQVLPRILCVAGVDGELLETELPIGGNSPEGFVADTTVPTGTLGNILVETDGAVGAGTPLEVRIEVEEI